MRSKGFVSAFFIATTSGHSVQKWKGKGNEQKRCEEIIYEEEMNWWDKDLEEGEE